MFNHWIIVGRLCIRKLIIIYIIIIIYVIIINLYFDQKSLKGIAWLVSLGLFKCVRGLLAAFILLSWSLFRRLSKFCWTIMYSRWKRKVDSLIVYQYNNNIITLRTPIYYTAGMHNLRPAGIRPPKAFYSVLGAG